MKAEKFNENIGTTRHKKWGVFNDSGEMAHDKAGNVLVWRKKKDAVAWINGEDKIAEIGMNIITPESASWIEPLYEGDIIIDHRVGSKFKAGDKVIYTDHEGVEHEEVVRGTFIKQQFLEPYARNRSFRAVVLTEFSWAYESNVRKAE